ncbi:hypothetical protein BJ138DRAFT_262446 [Hygrophoropsis aurantiaca]|uniref:Uncharacterized protein n=1 Tax=Hygrophoropsis aurantiaca TaxID=72124 RepID=A0ACB8A7C9_9AGAM|nr:hypothetical protein BJ138DRAFT_262446 [Hygrophoropsis aurantiaca]
MVAAQYLVSWLRFLRRCISSRISFRSITQLLSYLSSIRLRLFSLRLASSESSNHTTKSTETLHPENDPIFCPSLAPSNRPDEGDGTMDIPYPNPPGHLLPRAPRPMGRHPRSLPILTESSVSVTSTNHLDTTNGKTILRSSSAAPNGSQHASGSIMLYPLGQHSRNPNQNTPPPQKVDGYRSPGTSLRPVASRASSQHNPSPRLSCTTLSGIQSRSSFNSCTSATGRSTYRRHDGQTPRTLSNLRSASTPDLPNLYDIDQTSSCPHYPAGYTAPPSVGDPHHPGEPVYLLEGPRFCPMSTRGVRRYDREIGTIMQAAV